MKNCMRYERKFIVDLNKFEIEHLIKHHPAMFSEIFYERNVNNVYFDSEDLTNYHENLSGDAKRLKIRIRWYGDLFGLIKKPILELKIKENELGRKLSYPLKSFNFDRSFTFEYLQEILNKSNLPEWLIENLKIQRPRLLNSYKRKYFSSNKFRITLDRDLKFFKMRNRNNLFQERNLNINIVEIKYPYECYEDIERITNKFPFRLIAISKYVTGVELVN